MIISKNIKVSLSILIKNSLKKYDKKIIIYEPQEGKLYCIFNEMYSYYGKNVYKCGTSHDPYERLKQYVTSYPKKSEIVIVSINCCDKFFAENLLFYMLNDYKLKQNREFINCEIDKINHVFTQINTFFNKYDTPEKIINYLLKLPNPFMFFKVPINDFNDIKNIFFTYIAEEHTKNKKIQ